MRNKRRVYKKDGLYFYEDKKRNTLINLTLMFGEGIEPKTVEEVEKHFPPLFLAVCEASTKEINGNFP